MGMVPRQFFLHAIVVAVLLSETAAILACALEPFATHAFELIFANARIRRMLRHYRFGKKRRTARR